MGKKEAKEWLSRAKKDMEEAEFLLKNDRALEFVGFFIQQAVEKYLKGFLISHGWELEKIHDLITLLGKVIEIDKKFEEFAPPLQRITKYYLDSRYPLGFEIRYTREEMEESLKKAKELIALIEEKFR